MSSIKGQENLKESENVEYECILGSGGYGEVHKVSRITAKAHLSCVILKPQR